MARKTEIEVVEEAEVEEVEETAQDGLSDDLDPAEFFEVVNDLSGETPDEDESEEEPTGEAGEGEPTEETDEAAAEGEPTEEGEPASPEETAPAEDTRVIGTFRGRQYTMADVPAGMDPKEFHALISGANAHGHVAKMLEEERAERAAGPPAPVEGPPEGAVDGPPSADQVASFVTTVGDSYAPVVAAVAEKLGEDHAVSRFEREFPGILGLVASLHDVARGTASTVNTILTSAQEQGVQVETRQAADKLQWMYNEGLAQLDESLADDDLRNAFWDHLQKTRELQCDPRAVLSEGFDSFVRAQLGAFLYRNLRSAALPAGEEPEPPPEEGRGVSRATVPGGGGGRGKPRRKGYPDDVAEMMEAARRR